jgi:hypothetical protein
LVSDTAVLAFVPSGEAELANVPGLSVGIMSASQGSYSAEQLLLDITQGARVADSSYSSTHPPAMALLTTGAGGTITGWQAALRRAESAPQLLRPGLLAAQIPGGAAYAGVTGADDTDAIAAANRGGEIHAVSLGPPSSLPGPPSSLPDRVARLQSTHDLIVTDLPAGAAGHEDLRTLSAGRRPGELLLVVQRARSAAGHELLWVAAGGLAGGGERELTSQTTSQRGLIASVDIAPTILRHLDLAVPADMRGEPIHTDGRLDSSDLRSLMVRLRVIAPRRLHALGWLLVGWVLLLLPCAPWPRARAWAMRTGALGVLWTPAAVLIPAALAPSAAVEYLTIALICLALGALTDRLLKWPRALLAPAIAAVVALTADALAGTQLLMRSLLGPDPALGARFYGIGNELKSGLAVLVFAAVAAAFNPVIDRVSARGRQAAFAMAGAGIVLAVIEGSARIGAGVGGVILVSFGAAVATMMLLPGSLTRRRALIALIAPVLALILLAALDLATAHGGGHYTGSVLHARSLGDLRDLIVRRYTAAWDELGNHAMPVATALALLCAGFGLLRRERLLAPVDQDPVWLAALCGGLAAGVLGALVEDSGPVLLVVAVFALGCVLTYLWAQPQSHVLLRSRRGRGFRCEPIRSPDRHSSPP